MIEQNFINFKQKRDLGAMLSDTFQFLNAEWKPFFGSILKISIIPILIAICALVYSAMTSVSFLGDFYQVTDYDIVNINFSDLILPISVAIISYLTALASITVAALAYIKSYTAHKGLVNFQEIQNLTKEKFWPYVGLFTIVGVIVFFGMLFCILPGIYFGVVLSLSFCLVIFQNKGVFDAISDSFGFIKEHWWETFGILIVVQLLIAVVSFLLDLPASFYQTLDIGSILKDQDTTELSSAFADPIYLSLIVFSYFAKFILHIVSIVVSVFIYYDIREQKNPSSDIINEIGVD